MKENKEIKELINTFMDKINILNIELALDEQLAIEAGLEDILEARDIIYQSLLNIKNSNEKEIIEDEVNNIHGELIFNILPHLQDIEEPLYKLLN